MRLLVAGTAALLALPSLIGSAGPARAAEFRLLGSGSLSAGGWSPPPWAATSPSAAGARFGFGLGYLAEEQERLVIASQRTVVTLRDLMHATSETTLVPGDPRLLNRKFDLDWELSGPFVDLLVGHRSRLLPRGLELHSTLGVEVALAEATLRFHDRQDPPISTSLGGRGAMLGAWAEVASPLCWACPWYAASGYRFRTLRDFEVDRSPAFAGPGLRVLADEVRLRRDAHELTARLGYVHPPGRIASYAGVRQRWTDLEVDDRLRYVNDQLGLETTLDSRLELDSDTLEAVAGVEAYLGRHLFARTEASAGDGDRSLQVEVVYQRARLAREDELASETRERLDRRAKARERRAERVRAREIASAITPELARIAAEFSAGCQALTLVSDAVTGEPGYLSHELRGLLDRTERDLLGTVSASIFPELGALRDYVSYRFEAAREEMQLGDARGATGTSGFQPLAKSGVAGRAQAMASSTQVLQATLRQGPVTPILLQNWAVPILKGLRDALRQIESTFQESDGLVRLCFNIQALPSVPQKVVLYPPSLEKDPAFQRPARHNEEIQVYLGLYFYEAGEVNCKSVCPDRPWRCCVLNLVEHRGRIVDCAVEIVGSRTLQCGLREGRQECTDHG